MDESQLKYKEILGGTAQEAKDKIAELDDPNLKNILRAERNGKDRETLKQFIKTQIGEQETKIENEDEEKDEIKEILNQETEKVKEQLLTEDVDYLEVAIKERKNQDREELVKWLKDKAEKQEAEKDVSENNFKELESKMKGVIDNLKEDNQDVEQKINDINQEINEGVKKKGRTTKPKNQKQKTPKQSKKQPEKQKQGKENQNLSKEEIKKKDEQKRREAVEKHAEESGEELDSKEALEKKNFGLDEDDSYEQFEERIEQHQEEFSALKNMMQEVIVGQEKEVERIIIAMMCDGNILLEGVPGLGKSLLVETLSKIVSGTDFNRIQFVPDMLPSDILGQRVYNQEKGEFYINKGPVFTNFLLADEINRAPPKTQAALMEIMQEKKVSIEKEEFDLEPPYLVLATQNPLEQKGTYPLPEAVIDRFFMKLVLDYPEPEDEVEILQINSISSLNPFEDLEVVSNKEKILQVQEDVRRVHVSAEVQRYIVEIVGTARGTRENDVKSMKYVDYGPGPRASIWLSLGAAAYAILDGRTYALPDDVKKVAKPVLRHRILMNYEGKISDYDSIDVIEEILEKVDTV